MSWAELLTVFNFVTWFLPILLRSWIAYKFKSPPVTLSKDESDQIESTVRKLDLSKLKVDE